MYTGICPELDLNKIVMMKTIIRICGLVAGLSLFILSTSACAAPGDVIARQGVDQLLRLKFDDAMRIFDQLEKRHPSYPLLGFLRASTYWVKAEASQGAKRKHAWEEASRHLLVVIKQAKQELEQRPQDPLWRLNLGMSQFFAGRVHIDGGRFLQAIRYARAGRDVLRDLIKEYPDMEDAYFVLGMYEYLAGSVPRGLRWLTYLLGVSGNRDLGIRYLERATAKASIMGPEAARMLLAAAAIQPEHVAPCQYLHLAKTVRQHYPENPHFSGALQLIYVHCGYAKAALKENARARAVYLKRFPEMIDALNLVKLQAHRSLGSVGRIKAMRPVFEKNNLHHWYLALAEAHDIQGKRAKALEIYSDLILASEEPESSENFSEEPPEWVVDQAYLRIKIPYRSPDRVPVDHRVMLSLHQNKVTR